jgi:hypothetical protein
MIGAVAGTLVMVTLAVVALVLLLDGDREGARARASQPAASPPAESSSVTGRITDPQAGFTYARLDEPWTDAKGEWLRPSMFTSGQVAPIGSAVNGVSFNALSLAGVPRPDESRDYRTQEDLRSIAGRVKARVRRELFTVQHTEKALTGMPRSFGATAKGWYESFRLDFPQAAPNGWPVKSANLMLLLVDADGQDGGHLGLLLVALPDAFTAQMDMDTLLNSVQVP